MISRRLKVSDVCIIVFVAVILTALLVEARDCRLAHGHYVRGLFWMECLK
jgi:hypothetical protein